MTRPGAIARRSGSTLIELLVTVAVSSVVLLAAATFFSQEAKTMRGSTYRTEVQQALVGSLDAITRDIRLAGACLPTTGIPVALDGFNNEAAGDRIVIRSGLTGSSLTCVSTGLTAPAAAGATAFTVANTSGFVVGKMALAWNGGDGDFFRVTSISGSTVRVDHGARLSYVAGNALYAVDQRQYYLDRSRNPPVLMLQVDQQTPQIFAAGIDDLDFVYVLARNCPPCDQSDLSTPLSNTDWRLVNEVTVTALARSVGASLPGDMVSLTETGRAKPRNLLQ